MVDANADLLAQDQLRLVTAGSVDDGKSTLVGRLLYDTKSIFADQFEETMHTSKERGSTEMDLALLTDGLRAERERGITIDVAYRYFSTPRRSFVLADAPGHLEYTRNTVTGASTADAAVVLVDVCKGVSPQTRRHAAVMSLLRVPNVIFAINKMDAVDWSPEHFARVEDEVRDVAGRVGLTTPIVLPISALTGSNVTTQGPDWYTGSTLLSILEELPTRTAHTTESFRLQVQLIIRADGGIHRHYRGLAGRVAAGSIQTGEHVTTYPSLQHSIVTAIDGPSGAQERAAVGESVTIRLADELDVARGEILTTTAPMHRTHSISATLIWLDTRPQRTKVLVKIGTMTTCAVLGPTTSLWHVDRLSWRKSSKMLLINDIARLSIELDDLVAVDRYVHQRTTGSFVVIDPDLGTTLAAGLVDGAEARRVKAGKFLGL